MSMKLGQLKLYPDDTGNPQRARVHKLLLSTIPNYIKEYESTVGIRISPAEAVAEMACHWLLDKYREAEAEAKKQVSDSQGEVIDGGSSEVQEATKVSKQAESIDTSGDVPTS